MIDKENSLTQGGIPKLQDNRMTEIFVADLVSKRPCESSLAVGRHLVGMINSLAVLPSGLYDTPVSAAAKPDSITRRLALCQPRATKSFSAVILMKARTKAT